MTHDEQDTALHLRREADAVVLEVREGQVDQVLTTVFARRARQRAQRTRIWSAVAVVALVVAGTALVGARFAHRDPDAVFATTVGQWPLRGGLAGDTSLLARAERVWRAAPNAPNGPVRPLFAGQSASMVTVVLAGHTKGGRAVVAFVTSPDTAEPPNPERLFVRAVTFPEPGARAVGFVATSLHPSDTGSQGSLAFALAAPGTPGVQIHSTFIDHTYGQGAFEEAFWALFPRGVGAWNSVIDTGDGTEWAGTGMLDPVMSRVMLQQSISRPLTEREPKVGDLLVTSSALYGVVVDPGGRVESSPTAWGAYGKVRVAISDVPGTLSTGPDDSLVFNPTGGGELAVGNRVVFSPLANPDVVVTVGKLVKIGGQWRVHRFLDPHYTPELLMSVSPASTQGK